ncbi:unnamed protein product [Mytilus edulis]|uniref:Uncharacterized protein n=1 Tax=Mytilus edulis TaxID=6550 RepID=A0A8S3PML4_MYTED|nr:unnamed protein product [Mytilus edulis]
MNRISKVKDKPLQVADILCHGKFRKNRCHAKVIQRTLELYMKGEDKNMKKKPTAVKPKRVTIKDDLEWHTTQIHKDKQVQCQNILQGQIYINAHITCQTCLKGHNRTNAKTIGFVMNVEKKGIKQKNAKLLVNQHQIMTLLVKTASDNEANKTDDQSDSSESESGERD